MCVNVYVSVHSYVCGCVDLSVCVCVYVNVHSYMGV